MLLGLFTWSVYGVTGRLRPRTAAPVTGRPVGGFADSVGMFANTVLLPLTVTPGEPLRDQARRLAADTRALLDRQDVALADVLPDTQPAAGQGPFDFLFVLENTDFAALDLAGCTTRPLWPAPTGAKCPMTLSVIELGDGLECLWEYADGHFTEQQAADLAALFARGIDLLSSAGPATPWTSSPPTAGPFPTPAAAPRRNSPGPPWPRASPGRWTAHPPPSPSSAATAR